MACKLIITDPHLVNVFGAESFDTATELFNSIKPGTKFQIKGIASSAASGDFVGSFTRMRVDVMQRMLFGFTTPYGSMDIPADQVVGRFDSVKGSDAKLDETVINPVLPSNESVTDPQQLNTAEPDHYDLPPVDGKPVYDPDESAIKFEQYESTTGQDVGDENGRLSGQLGTIPKMALRHMIAERPFAFRYFIVKDSDQYFNEPGVEPTGEVLLVVSAAAHDMVVAEKGRALTQEELGEVAVRMENKDGQWVVRESGQVFTLPLEGGADDSFFSRNHEERLELWAEKYDTTIEQAEQHFLSGKERMQKARQLASTRPVEVNVMSVSNGFPSRTEKQIDTDQFVTDYSLTNVKFVVSLKPGQVKGRVYLTGTLANGQTVEMLTVPIGIKEKYGEGAATILWDAANSQPGSMGVRWLESLVGTNRRKNGLYYNTGKLHFNGVALTSSDEVKEALSINDWPILSNKVRGNEGGASGVSISRTENNGAVSFSEVSNEQFVKDHVRLSGSLWKDASGKVVPYMANRYLYLNVNPVASTQRLTTQEEHTQRIVDDLFLNPREYDRILLSDDPDDLMVKFLYPHLFSKDFVNSESIKRLRKRMPIQTKPIGEMSIPYPVGGRYFGSKSVVSRKIGDILDRYEKGNVPFVGVLEAPGSTRVEQFNNYINAQVKEAMEQGVTVESFESQPTALFTHFANKWVADREREILLPFEGGNMIRPNSSPSWWKAQPEAHTLESTLHDDVQRPAPIWSHTEMKGVPPSITLDAYRTFMQSTGRWTNEMEQAYLNEIRFVRGDAMDESKGFPATSVTLGFKGPSFSYQAGNGMMVFRQFDARPVTLQVIVPSKIGKDESSLLGVYQNGYHLVNFGVGSALESGLSVIGFYEQGEVGQAGASADSVSDTPQTDAFLNQLEGTPLQTIAHSPEFDYAVQVLGKNFAQKLFSSGQMFTFADINRFRADLGKPFSFTKFLQKRDFSLSPSSANKIANGEKTISLRNPESPYLNKSGLLEIDGEVFDVQEIGLLSFEEALAQTGLTQQEFAKAFTGEDNGIESVFDENVKAFFNGNGKRRVYTFRQLSDTVDPRKLKSKKKPLPCGL